MQRVRWRFALALALFGFLANAALFAYMQISDYTPLESRWAPGSFSILSVQPHRKPLVLGCSNQAIVNTAIYFGLGAVAGKFL
jgi:hypothetical protein